MDMKEKSAKNYLSADCIICQSPEEHEIEILPTRFFWASVKARKCSVCNWHQPIYIFNMERTSELGC